MTLDLRHGDCLEVLRTLADNSIDAIVTDPPYGLSFMGKRWDYDVPSEDVWRECLRVLKPGGHLLAFAGTRTQHRMAVRIEDAGFEIRDMIAWVYGSGFPKSLDVSKALDKCNGEPDRLLKFTAWMRTTGLTAGQINEATGTFMASHYLTAKTQPAIPTRDLWAKLRPLCGDVPAWVDELVERIEAERKVVGARDAGRLAVAPGQDNDRSATVLDITAPATDAARQWAGWGTALKPALEPVTVARKPLAGTVAANVLAHGTGALNIDGCRVGLEGMQAHWANYTPSAKIGFSGGDGERAGGAYNAAGRWPANLIHDGSEDVLAAFPDAKGAVGMTQHGSGTNSVYGKFDRTDKSTGGAGQRDAGSAARFFYCAKASKRDRDAGNIHPTVKPTDLMRYLCRLVTPPGGVVLDPFMGSGSTGKAARLEGFGFVGIEREAEYLAIARARIEAATPEATPAADLFGAAA